MSWIYLISDASSLLKTGNCQIWDEECINREQEALKLQSEKLDSLLKRDLSSDNTIWYILGKTIIIITVIVMIYLYYKSR